MSGMTALPVTSELRPSFFERFSDVRFCQVFLTLERLVLIGPDDDGGAGVRRILPDDGPEFDIPVTRK
jgi:hypothetical protein